MSRGMTIADLVQQVLYAMYKVRLDVDASKEGAFHSKSDKFKEIVMEANFVLQEFQKEQDWNFLRERWEIGYAHNSRHGIQEFEIPEGVYKLCTGYNDAVRMHYGPRHIVQIPFDSPRSGNHNAVEMFDEWGSANVDKDEQRAFVVGDVLTFYRPWYYTELGHYLETDVISYIERPTTPTYRKQKLTEALGWNTTSYYHNDIADFARRLSENPSEDESVRKEALKTYNRVKMKQ